MITREGMAGKQEGRKGGRKLECRQVRTQDARDSRDEATALARASERSSLALANRSGAGKSVGFAEDAHGSHCLRRNENPAESWHEPWRGEGNTRGDASGKERTA